IRRAIATGMRGSLMPAFAKPAGGTLTDEQIEILVRGMRTSWAKPKELLGISPPAYAAVASGVGKKGGEAYGALGAGRHGTGGQVRRAEARQKAVPLSMIPISRW